MSKLKTVPTIKRLMRIVKLNNIELAKRMGVGTISVNRIVAVNTGVGMHSFRLIAKFLDVINLRLRELRASGEEPLFFNGHVHVEFSMYDFIRMCENENENDIYINNIYTNIIATRECTKSYRVIQDNYKANGIIMKYLILKSGFSISKYAKYTGVTRANLYARIKSGIASVLVIESLIEHTNDLTYVSDYLALADYFALNDNTVNCTIKDLMQYNPKVLIEHYRGVMTERCRSAALTEQEYYDEFWNNIEKNCESRLVKILKVEWDKIYSKTNNLQVSYDAVHMKWCDYE